MNFIKLLNISRFDQKKIKTEDLEIDATKKLFEIYVWANKEAESDPSIMNYAKNIFEKMEKNNEEQMNVWRLFRNVSIKELDKAYKRINVTFDEYHGESFYSTKNITEVLDILEEKKLLKTLEDGRKVCEVLPGRKETIIKSDGTTLYLTRDIAAALDRYNKYKFDQLIYVTDNSQTDHFRALFKILHKLGYEWSKNMKHIAFSRIQGMSTRKGNVIFLTDILDEAKALVLEKADKAYGEFYFFFKYNKNSVK